MSKTTEHIIRTIAIVVLTIAAGVGAALTENEVRTACLGALAILVPAVIDALRVARQGAGGGGSAALIVFLVAGLAGCAGTAAEVHARAAHATTESLTGAGELIRERRHHEQLEAVQAHEYREEAREAVDQVRQRWAPVLEGYEAVRTAANTWRAALLVYIIDGEEHPELWLTLAGEVVQHWRSWVELGERIGADIPEPPSLLTALLGGRR